jgi:hypothetical protein
MIRDKHSVNSQGYHIRSLYFDDLHDTALLEKNHGIIQRKKYRIRIYNKCDKKITLERKSRYGNLVSKESECLTKQGYQSILNGNYSFLKEYNKPLFHQFYIGLMVHRLRPIIIVDYIREAYTSGLGNTRITFDKELSAVVNTCDVFDPCAVSVPVLLPPKLIMEVKYDKFLPTHIPKMLHSTSIGQSAISKYAICREAVKGAHIF